MKVAISLYKGGQPFDADKCTHEDSKALGLICPFCKESVFLVRGFTRRLRYVTASWHHYKTSPQSPICEQRSLSAEGRQLLKQFSSGARKQRLELFNKRFWDIYCYQKHVPKNVLNILRLSPSQDTLQKIINYCHRNWNPEEISSGLSDCLKAIQQAEPNQLKQHPSLKEVPETTKNSILQELTSLKFSALRYKILVEVIHWLKTVTAKRSFTCLMLVAIEDCLEVHQPPIHFQQAINMTICSLVLTDWEAAIAALDTPTRGLGFNPTPTPISKIAKYS